MNLKVCDMCYKKGVIKPSKWKYTIRQSLGRLIFDLCQDHRDQLALFLNEHRKAEEFEKFVNSFQE